MDDKELKAIHDLRDRIVGVIGPKDSPQTVVIATQQVLSLTSMYIIEIAELETTEKIINLTEELFENTIKKMRAIQNGRIVNIINKSVSKEH